jgi:hypothetical protein
LETYQKLPDFIEYCNKISHLCQNDLDPKDFSKKLLNILKNLNKIKEEAKLRISIYIFEESNDT